MQFATDEATSQHTRPTTSLSHPEDIPKVISSNDIPEKIIWSQDEISNQDLVVSTGRILLGVDWHAKTDFGGTIKFKSNTHNDTTCLVYIKRLSLFLRVEPTRQTKRINFQSWFRHINSMFYNYRCHTISPNFLDLPVNTSPLDF